MSHHPCIRTCIHTFMHQQAQPERVERRRDQFIAMLRGKAKAQHENLAGGNSPMAGNKSPLAGDRPPFPTVPDWEVRLRVVCVLNYM